MLTDRACRCRALAELNSEFEGLEQEGARLEGKMDLRTKQFHLLLHTVQDLQNVIASDHSTATAMEED